MGKHSALEVLIFVRLHKTAQMNSRQGNKGPSNFPVLQGHKCLALGAGVR